MFHFPDLQNAFNDCNESLKVISITLDQMSEDIKKFETYLGTLHLLGDFAMPLRSFTELSGDYKIFDEFSYIYPGKLIRDELNWNSKDKRLNYVRYESDVKILSEGYCPPSPERMDNPYQVFQESITITKPLIECAISIRKHAFPFLGAFLKDIAAQYR